MEINAKNLDHKVLNEILRKALVKGEKEILLDNINGQRYLASGLSGKIKIKIKGTPGNDLACFLNGPEIIVEGNGQDVVANTMNSGKVVIQGSAGDVLGYGMRGGQLYIRGDVGYRVGIHMKAYQKSVPVIIIGGCAKDFLGEYLAGGIIIILGLKNTDGPIVGNYLGTGMHGGVIYVRGRIENYQLGKEVGKEKLSTGDEKKSGETSR